MWYAAVRQSFFSLTVSFGCTTMYASYNPFNHNLNRDVFIISIMDTFASLIAGDEEPTDAQEDPKGFS